MNGKRNPSILRMALLTGFALCAVNVSAQDIYEWEAWRAGRNIAGLALSSSPRGEVTSKVASSSAELTGGCTWGGFKDNSEASTLWSTGAKADTEVHFKDMLFTGDFSFAIESGMDMMGSMFTRPGYYPIDVLEFTPGAKILQRYGAGGGFAWKNASRFIPGGTFRFEGDNYAKRKDIRHTTYRQELEVVPSLVWDGPGVALGGSAIFSKTSEFVQAEQIGSATAESYYAFLDKGLMYGTYQVWDGNGIHLAEAGVDRLPVREFSWGGALQLSVGDWLYGDVEYLRSKGEIGEKGYTWFRFPGSTLSASLSWTLHRPAGVHVIRAQYKWSRQETDESVIEKTTLGGVTTPSEYGSNRIFESRKLSAGPSYGFYGDNGFELRSSLLVAWERDRSTLMYPFLDKDEHTVLHFDVESLIPAGPLDIEAGLLFGSKIGEHRHVVDNDNIGLGVTSYPFRLTDWYDAKSELDDAPRLGASLGLRYNFTIAHRFKLYVSASYSITHAFGITYLPGSNRQAGIIKFGYDF